MKFHFAIVRLMTVLSILAAANAVAQKQFLGSYRITDVNKQSTSLPPSNSVSKMSVSYPVLWIGSDKGLAKSNDVGISWVSYKTNPAFANTSIFAAATSLTLVWASTGFDEPISGGTVQTGSGFAWSPDSGQTWAHLPQTLDNPGDSILEYGINDSLRMLPVTVPEQNVTFDISLSSGTVWVASWASGLRKRPSGDSVWHRIPLPLDSRSSLRPTDTLWSYDPSDTLRQHRIFDYFDPRYNNNFLAFSVCAIDADTIWCGTAGGVNKSTDGGVSWVKFSHQNQASPILGDWVIAISQQVFGTTKRMWTTNWKADDPAEDFGVSYTDDGGRTWKNFLRGVKAYDFAFRDSIVYIASDDGIYRTADGGSSFLRYSYFSDPATRQAITSTGVYCIALVGDTVFIGTNDGIASTIDDAANPFGSAWKIYRTYQPVGIPTSTYAYPNPFSPAVQQVRIHYGPSSGAAGGSRTVSIDIFDFGMNRVRTLLRGASRPASSEADELWDGSADNGAIVANGVYIYRIRINGDEPIFGKILVLQ